MASLGLSVVSRTAPAPWRAVESEGSRRGQSAWRAWSAAAEERLWGPTRHCGRGRGKIALLRLRVFPPRPGSSSLESIPRASASADASAAGGGSEPGTDAEEEPPPPALGPEALQRFFEMNAGQWRGTFVQISFNGQPLQKIPVALSASAYGKGDLASLQQTLRIKPGPQPAPLAEQEGEAQDSGSWAEWKSPEMNRFSVDHRQQVAFFEEDGAYAVSHLTAEMLGEVMRVGVLGEDADEVDKPPIGVRFPSTRPALVSEVCLSAGASLERRIRAFHVLDPRGLIDTLAVFLEGRGDDNAPEMQVEFALDDLVGEWRGSEKVLRSDLYGGSRAEREVRTRYTADSDILSVESTRGGRTLVSNAHMAHNVLQFSGGLQSIFLPGGMSFSFPQVVPRGNSFFFEFAWIEPGSSTRQRIIRTFDPDGLVVSTSLVQEAKCT